MYSSTIQGHPGSHHFASHRLHPHLSPRMQRPVDKEDGASPGPSSRPARTVQSPGRPSPASPSLKREYIAEEDEEEDEMAGADEARSQHKVSRVEGDSDVTASAGAATGQPRESRAAQMSRSPSSSTSSGGGGNNYTWQPSHTSSASLMSITAISGGSPVRPGPSTQMSPLSRGASRRLPGIASLSTRPTSPPPSLLPPPPSLPQVARINAPRSYVSSNAGPSSMSSLANRAPAPSSATALPVTATQPAPGPLRPPGSASPSLTAQQLTGCPPIHGDLAGLPGSGSGPGNKQQPSFVAKLYSMLMDPTTDDQITWGPAEDSFSVFNPIEFSKAILPLWFKHANWQSFVRQLNMYGFHKISQSVAGPPNAEDQIWEFKHPSFRRGDVAALLEIKRKSSRHKRTDSTSQSYGSSMHSVDYEGGRVTSRSTTPVGEPYDLAQPRDFHFREPLPAHARVRSLTDAATRAGPSRFAGAMHQPSIHQVVEQQGEFVRPALPPPASSWATAVPPGHARSISIPAGPLRGPHMHAPPAQPHHGPSYIESGAPSYVEGSARGAPSYPHPAQAASHSAHLEDQLHSLEATLDSVRRDLQQVRREERSGKAEMLRIIHRLAGAVAVSDAASEEVREDQRRELVDVVQREISRMAHYLGLDPDTLNAPAGGGTTSTSPPRPMATLIAAGAVAQQQEARQQHEQARQQHEQARQQQQQQHPVSPPPPPPPRHRMGAGGDFSFPRRS